MKFISFLLIIAIFSLCSKQDNVITKNRIGVYCLGEKLEKSDYNLSLFDITVSPNNKITSIITFSSQYKTVEGFGVSSTFKEVKAHYKNISVEKMSLNKGDVNIGTIGESILIAGVLFVDTNHDDAIDFVMISIEK